MKLEVKKYNPGEFLEKYSPKGSYSLFKSCTSIEKCIRSDAPALSTICKKFSNDFVVKYIQLWMVGFNEFLNIKNKMNPEQIQETARILYDSYYYLNIADLNLIFTDIKRGKYGQIYESLDGTKLISWIDSYVEKRLETSLNCGGVKKIMDLGMIGDLDEVKMIGK